MRRVRQILFWSHLFLGATAGLVILIMSATGAALALKPQVLEFLERDVRVVSPEGTRLPPSAVVDIVKRASPEAAPQSITVKREATAAVSASLGRGETLYVNPYTGAVLGTGAPRATAFFQWLTDWHRWLGADAEARAPWRRMTGASNAAFLMLALSGLYLWWPRQFSLRHFGAVLWFRRTSTSRARDFNWHNVIGFWCLPAIIVMTLSGVVISYPWASNLVYRLTGSPVPERGGRGGPARGSSVNNEQQPVGVRPASPDVAPVEIASLDQLWSRAEAQVPTWSTLSLRLPSRPGGPAAFTITDGASWNAFARSQLTLNGVSGEVMQWQPYEGSSLGQKWRGWLRFAHTGELGGLTGQVIAGIGCMGGVMLVYTGLALAFRRLWNWSLWKRARSEPRTPHVVSAAVPGPGIAGRDLGSPQAATGD